MVGSGVILGKKLGYYSSRRVGLFQWRGVTGAGNEPKPVGARQPCDISVAVGAWHHGVALTPDQAGRHAGAMEALDQRPVVEVRRLEAHEGAEAQHLIAPHLLLDVAASVREEAQRQGCGGALEQQRPQRRVVDAALGLRMHEHVADRLPRNKQTTAADQDEPPNTLGMAHCKLGRDPAADTVADEIKASKAERIEYFEIVEQHVIDAAAAGELVGSGAARMRGRDQACRLRELPMKRLQVGGDPMHVGKAMQIEEWIAVAGFDHRDFAALDIKRSHAAFDCLKRSWCAFVRTYADPMRVRRESCNEQRHGVPSPLAGEGQGGGYSRALNSFAT